MSSSNDGIAGCLGQLLGLGLIGVIFFFVIKCQDNDYQEEMGKDHQEYVTRFDYDLNELVERVKAQYPNFSSNYRPFRLGKTLLFEKREGYDYLIFNDNWGLLQESVAFNKSELAYIVIKEYSEEKVDMYNNNETAAIRLNMTINVLDPESLEIIASRFIRGKEPPNSISYRGGAPESKSGSVGMTVEQALEEMAESSHYNY